MTVVTTTTGGINIYGLDDEGYFCQRTYFGYTRREAVAMFAAEFGKDA